MNLRLAIMFLLLSALPVLAQDQNVKVAIANGSVTLNFIGSATAGATTNVYRAPCTSTITSGQCSVEGTFAIISVPTVPTGTNTYTDSAAAPGAAYSYYLKSLCAPAPVGSNFGPCGADPVTGAAIVGESATTSNHVGVLIPFPTTTPAPPSSLTIGTVVGLLALPVENIHVIATLQCQMCMTFSGEVHSTIDSLGAHR